MTKTSWYTANNYYKSSTGRIVTQRPYDAFSYRVLAQISIGSVSSISEPDEWYIDETGESLHDPLAARWLSQIL